jgi:hypothetical protein
MAVKGKDDECIIDIDQANLSTAIRQARKTSVGEFCKPRARRVTNLQAAAEGDGPACTNDMTTCEQEVALGCSIRAHVRKTTLKWTGNTFFGIVEHDGTIMSSPDHSVAHTLSIRH